MNSFYMCLLLCSSLQMGTTRTTPSTMDTDQPTQIIVAIEEPAIQTGIKAGDTIGYRCTGRSEDEGTVSIQWEKESGQLPTGRSYSDTNGVLIIAEVKVSDSGKYICRVSDGVQHETQNITLTVEGCSIDEWECSNGYCINQEFRCDFFRDCRDGSDEHNCSKIPENCPVGQWACSDGCIDERFKCDWYRDCHDGTDEDNCSPSDYEKTTGQEESEIWVKLGASVNVSFSVEGYNNSNCIFEKINDPDNIETLKNLTTITNVTETNVIMTLQFTNVTRKDNGTYQCKPENYKGLVQLDQVSLIITEVPEVNIEFASAIAKDSVELKWSVNEGNDPVRKYFIEYMMDGSEKWQIYEDYIGGENSSYILEKLENFTLYRFRITATNSVGDSEPAYSEWVETSGEASEAIM